jgi:hypothetical protein
MRKIGAVIVAAALAASLSCREAPAFFPQGKIPGYDKVEFALLKVVGNTFTGRLYNLTNRDLDFSSRCQFIKNGGVIETSYINEYIPPNAYVEFSAYVSKGEELTTADLRWIPIGTDRAFDPVNVPVWSAAGDAGGGARWRNFVLEKSDYEWRLRGDIDYSGPPVSSATFAGYIVDGSNHVMAQAEKILFGLSPGTHHLEITGSLPSAPIANACRFVIRVVRF